MLQQEYIDVNLKRAQKYQYESSKPEGSPNLAGKTKKDRIKPQELRVLEQKELKNEDEFSDSSSQVSLEQDLLEEHLSVINQKIEIYQICFTNYNLTHLISNSSVFKKQQTLKLDSLQNYIVKVAHTLHQQPYNLIQNFLKYLQKETKFCNYLRHIYYSFGTKISQELVQLVFKVWTLYIPYCSMNLNLTEIEKMGNFIHKKILQKERSQSNQTTFMSQAQQKQMSYKSRLYFILTTTTLLVMQGIFKNPFYDESQDETEEAEDEIQSKLYERNSKRLKTQDQL